MTQNDAQVIVERILITADTMGNSFSSSSFTGGSNQQLDTWAAQACGCVTIYNLSENNLFLFYCCYVMKPDFSFSFCSF